MSKEIWQIKNGYGKVIFETNNKNRAADIANYYNSKTKLPTQHIKLTHFNFNLWALEGIDINKQNKKGGIFTKTTYEHPFACKDYNKKHTEYLKKKGKLCQELCYQYHYWAYSKRDGHKMCGFDF